MIEDRINIVVNQIKSSLEQMSNPHLHIYNSFMLTFGDLKYLKNK